MLKRWSMGITIFLFIVGVGAFLAGFPPFFSKRALPEWVKTPIAHRGLFDKERNIPENIVRRNEVKSLNRVLII